MDRSQVRFILALIIGLIWAASTFYEYVKKRRRRASAKTTRRRPAAAKRDAVRQTHVQRTPIQRAAVAERRQTPTPVRQAQKNTAAFSSPETEGMSSLGSEPVADDSLSTTGQTSPPCEIEDLRRAVIWSEILRRKF